MFDGKGTLPTPNAVVLRLGQLSRELDAHTDALEKLEREAVEKRHAYEIAFARAFLGGDGSVDARKQRAFLDNEHAKFEAETAEAVLRAARTKVSTLKMQIETGRSMNALLRAEAALAGTGVTP